MQIIQSILTKNPCYTEGRKLSSVKGLMLHSVGCPQPSAAVFIKSWNRENFRDACVHAFVDANTGNVYQTLPWDCRGWHAGGKANNTHIGVEMCEPNCIKYTGGSTFNCSDVAQAKRMVKKVYDSAVILFATLCEQYSLNPMADGVIISHAEGYKKGVACNHGDPEHLWNNLGMGYTMDEFRKAVKDTMNKRTKCYEKSIMDFQRFLNKNYGEEIKAHKDIGKLLAVDGKCGPKTKLAATIAIQIELNRLGESLVVDGGFGKLTRVAMSKHMLKKGDRGNLVYILQGLLYGHGYDPKGFDGSFGANGGTGCMNALKNYQTDNNLEVDGKAGGESFASLIAC